jgi:hypothetical protein
MTEYLIAFNNDWVPEHTDEELREKSRALRPLLAEMKAAGVYIFTGGLDDTAPVFSVDASMRRAARHGSPTVRSSSPRSSSAASPSWMCPTRRPHGCGRERSRWPAGGRRRCAASRYAGNFRSFPDGIGGCSCREALSKSHPARVICLELAGLSPNCGGFKR